jgi:tRNA1Val (adenine37-N6)-methyltransferase
LDDDLTRDAVLGGRLMLWQPRKGFRFGIDAVLLAAAVPARSGQRVLELGCGVGTAVFCLGARVQGLALTGVERQPDYAALAMRNADDNGVAARILTADLMTLPPPVRAEAFDHILMNPPYFDRTRSLDAADAGRNAARGGDTALTDWVTVAARRLAPRGTLTIIQRATRLPEILTACDGRLGSLTVLPLSARSGRAPEHIILRAVKDGQAPFRLLAPLVLHDGAAHESDAESYTAPIRAVLREGTALPWGD